MVELENKALIVQHVSRPVICGLMLTVASTLLLIFISVEVWFSKLEDEFKLYDLQMLSLAAETLQVRLRSNIQEVVSDLNAIGELADALAKNPDAMTYDLQSYSFNAINFTGEVFPGWKKGEIPPVTQAFPDINGHEASIWYLNSTTTRLSSLTRANRRQLNYLSAIDVLAIPLFEARSSYKVIFGIHVVSGLFFQFPAVGLDRFTQKGQAKGYSNCSVNHLFDQSATSDQAEKGPETEWNPRCETWYRQMMMLAGRNKKESLFLLDPDKHLMSVSIGGTACRIVRNAKKEVTHIFCIEYNGEQVIVPLSDIHDNVTAVLASSEDDVTFRAHEDSYYYLVSAEDRSASTYFHPQLRGKSAPIVDLEAPLPKEREYFEREILPKLKRRRLVTAVDSTKKDNMRLLQESAIEGECEEEIVVNEETRATTYSRNGKVFRVAILPICLEISGEIRRKMTMVYARPQRNYLRLISELKETIRDAKIAPQFVLFLHLSILFLMVFYKAMSLIADRIIAPIEALIKLLQALESEEADSGVRDFSETSHEIKMLYRAFLRLQRLRSYLNASSKLADDSEALINYAQALTLFKSLNYLAATGIIHNNIGNLHLRNGRIKEALQSYRAAVAICEDDIKMKLNAARIKKLFGPNCGPGELDEPVEVNIVEGVKTLSRGDVALYANRLAQLANALYNVPEKSRGTWGELAGVLERVVQLDFQVDANHSRIVRNMIGLAQAHIAMEEPEKAVDLLVQAEETLFVLQKVGRSRGTLDRFEVPADVLMQQILHERAGILKLFGQERDAAILYRRSLESGRVYDPVTRRKTLEALQEILSSQGFLEHTVGLSQLLASYTGHTKEVVFLLDYSSSMGKGARIDHAVRNLLVVFDKYVKEEDRIALITFDLNCRLRFGMTGKKGNRIQLRKQIESCVAPGGATAMFDAVVMAVRVLNESRKRSGEETSRWIVALTDGEDTASEAKFEDAEDALAACDASLVAIGLGVDMRLAAHLKRLCGTTPRGMFIESPTKEGLDAAFQSMSQTIFGDELIVESLI